MAFGRPRGKQVKIPVSTVEAQQAQELQQAWTRRYSLDLALSAIGRSIIDYPSLPKSNGVLDDYDFSMLSVRRHREGIVRAARFTDGIAVAFTTRAALEDRAHYLVLPRRGEPKYGVRAINVDVQAVGSATRTFTRGDALSEDINSLTALHYCAGALAVEAVTGWSHALQVDDLAKIQHAQEGLRN